MPTPKYWLEYTDDWGSEPMAYGVHVEQDGKHWRARHGLPSNRRADSARNIFFWGLLLGGEELHNNHHAHPGRAKFSRRWWEIDIGWAYIRALELLGLAR